jgi:hypothetical protein
MVDLHTNIAALDRDQLQATSALLLVQMNAVSAALEAAVDTQCDADNERWHTQALIEELTRRLGTVDAALAQADQDITRAEAAAAAAQAQVDLHLEDYPPPEGYERP